MIRVETYNPEKRHQWDDFVARSKNGVFLFQRGYLEYHADRFQDHSLLFYVEDKLVALLPANRREQSLHTHGGLTFGGFITDPRLRTPLALELLEALIDHARSQQISRLHYKAIPHVYHRIPAEEDLYALFRHDARLVRRDVSSAIRMVDRPALSKGRKWSAKRARSHGLSVRSSSEFGQFMAIEAEHLQSKYGVQPTHTAAEMEMLAGRFPENIKLFAAYLGTDMLGGVLVYESTQVAHAQYIAATERGKELSVLDAVLETLLEEVYPQKAYFDFGISTERQGRFLNVGLIDNKESYGARAVVYDHYELELGGS